VVEQLPSKAQNPVMAKPIGQKTMMHLDFRRAAFTHRGKGCIYNESANVILKVRLLRHC
jgi:hypothetical protein